MQIRESMAKKAESPVLDAIALAVVGLLLPWAHPTIVGGLREMPTIWDMASASHALAGDGPSWTSLLIPLSVPHLFYYLVWTNPSKWEALCKRISASTDPCHAFAVGAHFLKAFQALVLLLWLRGDGSLADALQDRQWGARNPATAVEAMVGYGAAAMQHVSALNPAQILLGTELAVLGQILNVGVYSAIGEHGVYYGCRLGKAVPWCHDFPFNVLPHPQYLGATLSIWGGCILLDGTLPYGVAAAMSCCYAFSSWVEAKL